MSAVLTVLVVLLQIYTWVLIARLALSWVQVFARDWRPTGAVAVLCEGVYSLTDPPLNFLRRLIPTVRIGGLALDLSFVVLLVGLAILVSFLGRLAWSVA